MNTVYFQRAAKFASDNSPTLLTAVGVLGVSTTAFLATKGGFKAARIIDEEQAELDRLSAEAVKLGGTPTKLTTKEKAQLTWLCYLPAVGAATLTCGAIIGSNKIGAQRTAAMATAFGLTEKALADYREKAVEHFGKAKEQKVADAVMADRVAQTPVPSTIIFAEGNQPCYDSWSGRYFSSNMETMKKAMNDLNHKLLTSFDNQASLNDFYNLLGIAPLPGGDEIGWNSDKMLDIEFTTCLTPEQRPAHALNYRVEPTRSSFRR